jgi:chromosome segregation ATPase
VSTYDDRLTPLEQKVAALSHNSVATQSDIFTHFAGFNRTVTALNNTLSEQEYAIRDARHEITILAGVVGDQGRDIKVIKGDLNAVKGDLSTVKGDLSTVKEDLSTVKEDLSTVKEDLSTVKEDLSTVKEDLNAVKISVDKRFDGVDKHLESLDKKFDQVLFILSALPRPQQET